MTKPANPFRYFDSSPEVIRLVVMMYVRYPLSLRNVEDLLFERGIDVCHETVRLWWDRFGPMPSPRQVETSCRQTDSTAARTANSPPHSGAGGSH
jgi:transposase-like protein